MAPKPDIAALKKTLATALQQARSKEVNFAFLLGKDGPVFEADPRKNPSILWAAARKQGGGNKGVYGTMSFDGGRLLLRSEEAPAGAISKAFKDFMASVGQSLRFEFLGPEAEVKPDPKPAAKPDTEAMPKPKNPETAESDADFAAQGDDDADDTPDDVDLAVVLQKARKRPMNIAWLIAKEGFVLRAHMRKPIATLRRQAMADGAMPRGAFGVINVAGKIITLTCAEEVPKRSFPQEAKKWLASLGFAFKVRIEVPGGESFESEDDEAAETTPQPAADPLKERLTRIVRDLQAAKSVLAANHYTGLAGLLTQAVAQKASDPGKFIKTLGLLETKLAGLKLPKPAPAKPAPAKPAPAKPAPAKPVTKPQAAVVAPAAGALWASTPPAPTPVAAITDTVTPERKARIDAWLKEFGKYDNAWQLGDDEGGEYVSEALLGKNAQLGGLTLAEKVYLAREAARMWRGAGSGENIQEAVAGIGDDPEARRALALGFAASAADTARIHAGGGATMDSPEGAAAEHLMMQKALDLDPGATIEAFAGAEAGLARMAAGVKADWMSRQRQKGLLDAVGNGTVAAGTADLMASAIFMSTQEGDLVDRSYRASLARAMGRVAGGDDPAAASVKLEAMFAEDGVREMMFGETITPELRNWALAQAANNPDFTAKSLADGWESEVASKAIAGPIVDRFTARGVEPFTLRTSTPIGALHNSIGQAMGITPTNLPPEDETPEARAAREAAGLDYDYYAGNEQIEKISAMIAQVGGDPAEMTVLPVVVTSNEFGVASFSVFRLERPDGPRFVDDMGNKYDSVDKWLELNVLPPGKMTYPEALVLSARLVTQNTPNVTDTLAEWVGLVGDYAALAVGITVGVIAIVGTGGLATPLVVAGAGAAVWQTARAGNRLYDQQQRGKDLTDLSDPSVRGDWLEAGAGVLSVGAMGAAVRTTRLLQSGTRVSQAAARSTAGLQIAADGVDAVAMGDQAVMMAQNWDRMGAGDKAMGLLNIAFWGGMAAASTRASGAQMQDALSFARLRNQAETGTPFDMVVHPDLAEGQMRTAYDLDDAGRVINLRIETGPGQVDRDLLELHSNVGRQIEASGGLMARLRAMLADHPNPQPGTQGWEAKLEIEKIQAETEALTRQLTEGGAKMTPLEREALYVRQVELVEATKFHMARLQAPDAMGEGWIAAPSQGQTQAKALGWPTGDALPEGHHWVSGADGQPTLRRSNGEVKHFSYNPQTRKFVTFKAKSGQMSVIGHGENEISFTQDAQGRTIEATAVLRRYYTKAERSSAELQAQREAGKRGIAGDEGGHIIGFRFDLDKGLANLFPQNAKFNKGAYKRLENEFADWIAAGGEVNVTVNLNEFTDGRPAEIDVSYEIINPANGDSVYDDILNFNNDGNQKYERVSSSEIRAGMATSNNTGM